MNNIPGVILAFDFGLKRIGTAIGNELSRTARPLKIINAEANDIRFSEIGSAVKRMQPGETRGGSALLPGREPKHE